jgi:hypothetical protein
MHQILKDSTSDISYLSGKHLGVQKTRLNCAKNQNNPGMMDDGQKFQIDNTGDAMASIELSRETLCKHKNTDKSSLYFVIYRNEKLFETDESNQRDESLKTSFTHRLYKRFVSNQKEDEK